LRNHKNDDDDDDDDDRLDSRGTRVDPAQHMWLENLDLIAAKSTASKVWEHFPQGSPVSEGRHLQLAERCHHGSNQVSAKSLPACAGRAAWVYTGLVDMSTLQLETSLGRSRHPVRVGLQFRNMFKVAKQMRNMFNVVIDIDSLSLFCRL
jgi:hypothetical protein